MARNSRNDWFYGLICIAFLATSGISYLFQIPVGSEIYFGLMVGFFIFFLILGIYLSMRSSKKKGERKAKEFEDEIEKKQNFAKTQRNIANQRGLSLMLLEERVDMELNQIPLLFSERKLNEAQVKLFNCRRIAIKNKFQYLIPKIEQLKVELQYLQGTQKREHIKIIKKKIIEIGTNVDRLFISDIIKSTKINDEDLIISIIKEMIEKKEIYAEYFSASKSIAFDLQANIGEIDKLMETYREWEEEEVEKKN